MTSRDDLEPDLGPRIGVDYADHECWEPAPCPQCNTALGWIYCDHPDADPDDDGGTPGWPECPICRVPLWCNRNPGMGRLSRVEELPDEPDPWDEIDEAITLDEDDVMEPDPLPDSPSPPRNLLDVIVSEIEPHNHQQVARLMLVYSLGDVELRAALDLVLVALTGWTMPVLQAKAEGRFHD